MTDRDEPPPRQFKFKPKEFERVNAPAGADAKSDDHDVYAIRQQVRAREQSAGMDDLEPAQPRKSKRTRDFWISLVAGWGLLLAAGDLIAGRGGLLAGAGLGLPFTIGLWWIFFHILDKY